MRAIDTNVIARYFLNDDPRQGRTARQVIEQGAFVPSTVILELGWLLGSRYRFSRPEVAAMLAHLIDLPSVTVSDRPAVRWALERYAHTGDLADLLHLVGSGPADSLVTFDTGVAKAAGADAPVPVETLA